MDSAPLILKTLDCLTARSVVTAENIANANTSNYRPLKVSFEDALKAAAAESDTAVQAVKPDIEQAPAGTADGELRLDLEMANAAATAGRYGALLEMLNRQIQMQTLAVTGTS